MDVRVRFVDKQGGSLRVLCRCFFLHEYIYDESAVIALEIEIFPTAINLLYGQKVYRYSPIKLETIGNPVWPPRAEIVQPSILNGFGHIRATSPMTIRTMGS